VGQRIALAGSTPAVDEHLVQTPLYDAQSKQMVMVPFWLKVQRDKKM
jgi:hypothetical protein